jgi:hypothetical protein
VQKPAIRTLVGVSLAGALAVLHAPVGDSSAKPSLQGVNFISVCAFSHRAQDDPIVFPGVPGASHDHTFVGNNSTNALSTLSSLRTASTSCQRKGDTAAYWMPTLFDGVEPVVPKQAIAYYRRLTTASLKPFPPGLQMVAGNSHAPGQQSIRVVSWDCGDLSDVARSSKVPDCPDGSTLSLHVNFPDCWDGKALKSPNQAHVAYSIGARCPPGHPVAMPALALVYRYPVARGNQPLLLASGGQNTGHADFFNSWNQPALAKLVASCLNRFRHCGTGT